MRRNKRGVTLMNTIAFYFSEYLSVYVRLKDLPFLFAIFFPTCVPQAVTPRLCVPMPIFGSDFRHTLNPGNQNICSHSLTSVLERRWLLYKHGVGKETNIISLAFANTRITLDSRLSTVFFPNSLSRFSSVRLSWTLFIHKNESPSYHPRSCCMPTLGEL